MKKIYLLLFFVSLLFTQKLFAATAAPSSGTISGAGTYCVGSTASALNYAISCCGSTVFGGAVTVTVKWYYNTTPSSVVAGATLLAGSTATFTAYNTIGIGGSGTRSYTPLTTSAEIGDRYYFCVLTWTGSGSCNTSGSLISGTQLVTVNNNPTSASATASPTTLCAGATLNLTGAQSGGAGTPTFSWAGPGYGGSTALSPGGFAVSASGSGIYTLTITTPGCTAITRTTASVTVNPVPTAVSASNSPNPVCVGQTLSLTGAATGATSYSWSGPSYGGSTSLNPAGFSASLANAGSFTLRATNSCGTTSVTTTVNVVTTPPTGVTASATPNPICTGAALSLLGTGTSATSFSWAGPAGSGYSSSSLNPAAFTSTSAHAGVFTLTATNGCGSTTATTTVSLGPLPSITSTYTPAWVCGPQAIFTEGWESGVPTSAGTPVDGWNTSAGSSTYYSQQTSSSYPAISGGHSGSYYCKFNSFSLSTVGESYGALRSPAFSMVGVTGASLTFWVYRDASGSYPSSSGYGTEGFKIYINTTTTAGGTQLGWVPRASDASPTGVSGTTTTSTSGWYQYTVAIPGTYTGATNYIFFSGVSAYGNDCYLDDISLTKQITTSFSIGTSGGTWSSANSAVASVTSAGLVAGVSAGSTTISYTVAGCAAPATKAVTVITATPAITAAGSPTILCIGSSITLSNTYPGGTWTASNTNATVTSGGVVTGATAGTVTITYAMGCGTTATYNLTVVGSPNPITGTTYACVGSTTTLSSTTTGYTWSSGSPTVASIVAATGAVTGVAAGTANITYSTGCGTDAYAVYTVNPIPAAISGVASICTLATSAAFTDASLGVTNSWSNTPTTYGTINASTGVFTSNSSVGTTTFTYTSTYASGSCYTTASLTVSNAAPAVISPASPTVCTGATTTLTDATAGGAWTIDPSSSGIATVSATGGVTGLSAGTAIISYSACGSVTRNVVVSGYSGTISSNSPLCTGSTLSLTSSISPTPTYAWTGPGFSSSLANPTRSSATTAYSGVYSLSVTTGGCARTFTTTVSVSAFAVSVTPSSASFCNGSSTSLTATITGAATPVTLTEGWESGVPTTPGTLVDGWNTTAASTTYFSRQSSDTHPTITNGHTGTYFNMFNSYSVGSAGSVTAYGAMVSPSFSMLGMNGTVSCWVYREVGGSYTTGTYLSEGFKIYANTTGSVSGATLLGFVPRTAGGTPTGVTGTANPGSSGWYQYTVAIPVAFVGATNYILFEGISAYGNDCYLDDITISTTATAATWSPTTRLYTNAGLTSLYSSATNAVFAVPTTSTNYTATVGTCTSAPAVITVAAQPAITSLTPSATAICNGQTVSLVAASTGGLGTATYTWRGSAITTTAGASATSPSFAPSATGSGTYSLSLSYTGTGCTTATSSVTVANNALPVASAVSAPASYCVGSGSVITLTSSAPASGVGSLVSYNWSGPAGYTATTAPGSPSVGFTPASTAASGIYSLTVTYSSASCTSNPVTTASVSVGANPSVNTVTGGTGCSAAGIAIGVNGSDASGITYALKLGAATVTTLSGASAPLSYGTIHPAGTYTVVATDGVGCSSNMTGSAIITQTPDIALGSVPRICQPNGYSGYDLVGFSTLSGAGTVGSYNIDWNTAAESAGFTDITAGAFVSGSIPLMIADTNVAGSFDANITVNNGGCLSTNIYPAHIIIYNHPTVTLTTPVNPCVNDATNIYLTGTDSATVDYLLDGSSNSFTFSGTTHTINTGGITASHTYIIQNAHNVVCSQPIHDTITIVPTPMSWNGGASGHVSDWSTAANWSCGFIPRVTDNVHIGAATHAPIITLADVALMNNLTVDATASLLIDSGVQVPVKGTFTNNSYINTQGEILLNNTTAQHIAGNGSINTLRLDNSAGATIDAGAHMTIVKTLYINSGTLNTGDSLELASQDTISSARIAELPSGAAIAGKVAVNQFVEGGYRRYRFWSHCFSDTMALNQIQNCIDITGGDTSLGFTLTTSGAPSAWWLDPLTSNSMASYDPGWKSFTNIKATAGYNNKMKPGQGIRLFFRGAKGEGLGYLGYLGMYTVSPVVVKNVGHVNQGTVNITLKKGSTDSTHQEYNMVGNPYPSPVDIGTILYNAKADSQIVGSAFYVWVPATGGGGAYLSVPIGIGAPNPYYIGANTAFQVRAHHNNARITFHESDKKDNWSAWLFKDVAQYVTLNVYDANYNMWDKLRLHFNEDASDKNDRDYDATKPLGSDFTFYSMSTEGEKLSIDARPYNAEKVIPLGITSAYEQEFIIRADNVAVPAGGSVYLHDKLLNKVVAITPGAEYKFAISKDKATQGDNRFELSMKPSAATPAAPTPKNLSVSMSPNPTTDAVKISFTSGIKEQVSVRVMDISGLTVYTQDVGLQQNGVVSVPLGTFAAGIYMVELTQGTQKITQKLVKE